MRSPDSPPLAVATVASAGCGAVRAGAVGAGALRTFLDCLPASLNVSLFNYRNHGLAVGKVRRPVRQHSRGGTRSRYYRSQQGSARLCSPEPLRVP